MPNDVIEISPTARAVLVELSIRTGQSPAQLLDAAVDSFRRALAVVFPVSSIPGVDPADVWEAAAQADAGRLTSHAEVFAKLRARP
jgi:hypothetical protein